MENERELNDNDNKLLSFCYDRRRSISEVARHLNIAPKNVSVRLQKLIDLKLIDVIKQPLGNKTFIRTKAGNKTTEHFVYLLKELKKRGGTLPKEEFLSLLPFT
jgi:Mn-dependent DtxR family transcriptional regulator